MKKIWMMAAALGLGIWLTGCSPAFVPVEDPSEPQTEERNSPETEKDDQREDLAFQPLSEEERRWIVTELESFDGDHKFSDMDPEKAASCGGEIRDAYDFVGRETENGYGYVLGFRKGKEDPLKDLSIYSIDDVIEAVKESLRTGAENPKGFMLNTGCQVSMGVPLENMDAFFYAARKYGAGAQIGQMPKGILK